MMRASWGYKHVKRLVTFLALVGGISLMIWLIMQADWPALTHTLRTISLMGFATIIAVYPLAIWLDALTWQPYFKPMKKGWRWLAELWKAQIIADAVLYITPLGVAGSEASKALILHRKHGISYSDATASLIGLQLLLALAQVPFIIIGMAVMVYKQVLPGEWQRGLIIATLVIALFMALLMLAIHKRWLQKWPQKIGRWKQSEKWMQLAAGLQNVEQQLATIMQNPKQFAATLLYAFANWACFAFEMWLIARVLGKPISFADAWAIETLVSMARAATFFIPAHLGAQDGATSFAFKIFYAEPTFGIAVALVRRARELCWVCISMIFGLADFRRVIASPPLSPP
jgi:glycosyltransferase 2 family protein